MSARVLIGLFAFTAHTMPAINGTVSATSRSFAPCWTAAMKAAGFISPKITPPATMFRTVVPPPSDEIIPVMSTPSAWKYFFSTAIDHGNGGEPLP